MFPLCYRPFKSRNLKIRAIWLFVLVQILLIFIFIKIYKIWPGSPKFKLRMYYDQSWQNSTSGLGVGLNFTQLTEVFFENLQKNPIYQDFNIKPIKNRPKVNLLIIVSSAPRRFERRDAIRKTWWTLCKNTRIQNSEVTVKCIFMTDEQKNRSTDMFHTLEMEKKKYNDIEFQSLSGGVEFGRRYMYHLYWSIQNYEYDYFMRMDDDYFVCLDKLIAELPMPAQKYLHWGWVHCLPHITRPEESIIMFSYAIVELFLSQMPEHTYCHPWADQLIATWVDELRLPIVYHTDKRLHHHPPAEGEKQFQNPRDVCKNYIGVHGSYPTTMHKLWNNRGDYELKTNDTLLTHSMPCQVTSRFNWKVFVNSWRYEPKLCIQSPVWDTKKQGGGRLYQGRQKDELGVSVK